MLTEHYHSLRVCTKYIIQHTLQLVQHSFQSILIYYSEVIINTCFIDSIYSHVIRQPFVNEVSIISLTGVNNGENSEINEKQTKYHFSFIHHRFYNLSLYCKQEVVGGRLTLPTMRFWPPPPKKAFFR